MSCGNAQPEWYRDCDEEGEEKDDGILYCGLPGETDAWLGRIEVKDKKYRWEVRMSLDCVISGVAREEVGARSIIEAFDNAIMDALGESEIIHVEMSQDVV